jgi:phosphoribosyl-dephospho-CoA transferase
MRIVAVMQNDRIRMESSAALPRHQFVWIDPTQFARGSVCAEDDSDLISAWFGAGRPAIVRRSEVETPGVSLGIALPLALERRRIALWASEASVFRSALPPHLHEAMTIAPHAWQPYLERLDACLQKLGADAYVYGSLGWQYLTGEIYLRAESDVDLLIVPRMSFDWGEALSLFEEIANEESPRFDGEITIGPDRAVAWRELLTQTDRVLVRSRTEIALRARAEVLAILSKSRVA